MKVALSLTAYDRPELLKQALENLIVKYPSGADAFTVVVDRDARDELGVQIVKVVEAYRNVSGFQIFYTGVNTGIAVATNKSVELKARILDSCDVVVHVDSDTYINKTGWARELAEFLDTHREIGLIAPDIPGRYMRIHRLGYDEIEYALGMVWAMRMDVIEKVWSFNGVGLFDQDIHHQWDPDLCLRIRMLGKRVGILPVGNLVDLGVGTGDSSKSESVWRGGFEFLKKWNEYFLGYFHYKAPDSLTWPMFPINMVWRRLWLSQFGVNRQLGAIALQGHDFDTVTLPFDKGKWNVEETEALLKSDCVLSGVDNFDKVDKELLAGTRQWRIKDVQQQS